MANVVTAKGREIIVDRVGATGNPEPKFVGWGNFATQFTAANTDVAPFKEAAEARTTGTSSVVTTTTTNDTYQVVGTITSLSGQTIVETFLCDTSAKTTAVDTVQASSGVIGSSSGTTVIVASGANFAANQFIQIRTEVMKITSIASNTLTVTRAQNGSAAISTIALSDTVTGGNPPGVSAVSNGNMFWHGDFTGVALNTNDSIQFTLQTKFS